MIPLFKPAYGEEELDALREGFRTGWVGLGPKTSQFEEEFAAYVGADYAIATNSATAALHLAVEVFGIGEGDEVLVPSLTFVSTVHAVMYCRATPVFVDVHPDTLCMDVADARLKITPRTKAIIPVHYGGHPCELDEIVQLAEESRLVLIEDAAHACVSTYKGKSIGSIGDATCFSFHAVKNLATGDGGMITTNKIEIVRALQQARWCGIDKSTWDRSEQVEVEQATGTRKYASYGWYYEVNSLGYKYHMNDIAAAIGLAQLAKLEKMNARRREISQAYNEALAELDWLQTPVQKPYVRSAHHNYVIKSRHRDELNLYLRDKGIATGVHYMPAHLQPYYRRRFSVTLPVTERIWPQLLTLPLFPDLTDNDFGHIVESIRSFRPGR